MTDHEHWLFNHSTPRAEAFALRPRDADDATVFDESWNQNVYHVRREQVEGQMALDVGANVGAFTLLCAALGASFVCALEPSPANMKVLRENVQLNGWNDTVTPNLYAVGSVTGQCACVGSGVGTQTVPGVGTQMVSLDDFLSGWDDEVGLMKMDCEGCEYLAIPAASEKTMLKVRHVAMEFHTTTPELFGALLAKLTDTHCLDAVLGGWRNGGMLWAHRNDV